LLEFYGFVEISRITSGLWLFIVFGLVELVELVEFYGFFIVFELLFLFWDHMLLFSGLWLRRMEAMSGLDFDMT
jgi:hypothetical protein